MKTLKEILLVAVWLVKVVVDWVFDTLERFLQNLHKPMPRIPFVTPIALGFAWLLNQLIELAESLLVKALKNFRLMFRKGLREFVNLLCFVLLALLIMAGVQSAASSIKKGSTPPVHHSTH